MIYIKTFENFSIDKDDLFNQSPGDVRNQLNWKGLLSENDKFSEFFSDYKMNDFFRENFLKIKDIDNKTDEERNKLWIEKKSSYLKEYWSKMWISIEDIIKENDVSFFTHVSLNPNLSSSSIKNSMNPM